ncbi:glycosyl transferase [Longispora fulva]|uniref:GT2 family glycosyltransferase n=1 Tax=Longispora fulva TaxID=619741 RepID=A0A8J7GIJ2_9ACTN|nr:glycosyltransferase family 2 protein [Longispora fulva]MBG6138145.1 GT2 family glycosyltransferase [Longispora fulva]GIG60398.1 glycosyl transferase [Longispora fulva]
MKPSVAAVVIAYGAEPYLEECVRAVLDSAGVDVSVLLVDNGCTSDQFDEVKAMAGVRVVTPDGNSGFAGGCDAGAAEADGDFLVFVNSDAVVAPDALARLVAVAAEPTVGLAMGSIRLADQPELMNTVGNPMHYTGMVWAGGFSEPATAHAERRAVPIVSGCVFAIRTPLWRDLGGFAPEYFMYHEDTELSIRVHHRGLSIEFVPDAVVRHYYEFSRNERKMYYVERNRLLTLFTTYEGRTLLVLAPMLAVTELAMVASSLAGGWHRKKFSGWAWLWRNRAWVARRRRQLQSERLVPDGVFARHLTARIDAANISAPPGVGVFNAVSAGYWAAARRLLRTR